MFLPGLTITRFRECSSTQWEGPAPTLHSRLLPNDLSIIRYERHNIYIIQVSHGAKVHSKRTVFFFYAADRLRSSSYPMLTRCPRYSNCLSIWPYGIPASSLWHLCGSTRSIVRENARQENEENGKVKQSFNRFSVLAFLRYWRWS